VQRDTPVHLGLQVCPEDKDTQGHWEGKETRASEEPRDCLDCEVCLENRGCRVCEECLDPRVKMESRVAMD